MISVFKWALKVGVLFFLIGCGKSLKQSEGESVITGEWLPAGLLSEESEQPKAIVFELIPDDAYYVSVLAPHLGIDEMVKRSDGKQIGGAPTGGTIVLNNATFGFIFKRQGDTWHLTVQKYDSSFDPIGAIEVYTKR